MMFSICPAHDGLDIRQVGVLRMPILANSAKCITDRTGRNRECVLLTFAISNLDPLHYGVDPKPRKLQEIHRAESLIRRGHAWIGKQHDAARLPIKRNPIRELSHRATTMEVVLLNDDRGRLFEVSYHEVEPLP
jgi:hypothetical protein